MRAKKIINLPASIRRRLLTLAKELGIDFNRILLLYIQERFLYRLSKSHYRDYFILKGGVLFYGMYQTKSRPTKDIDFLVKKLKNDPGEFYHIIRSIISIESLDGIHFKQDTISIEPIIEHSKYPGFRVKLIAKLGTATQSLQMDIGFSDIVIPEQVCFDYPVLLEDENIQLSAYSIESVVAEKFEAIVRFSDLNSRMKDFYDIYFLQSQKKFNGMDLCESIRKTFANRNSMLGDSQAIFSDKFRNDPHKQILWKAFLRKLNLIDPSNFSNVLSDISTFLEPVIGSINSDEQFEKTWIPSLHKWLQT